MTKISITQKNITAILVSSLTACGSIFKPNLDNMSEDELASYNSTIAAQEQVKCVITQMNYDRGVKKVCGTLSEIQELTKPQTPGARNNNAEPRFLNDIESQSRATNPPLRPVNQPRPFLWLR